MLLSQIYIVEVWLKASIMNKNSMFRNNESPFQYSEITNWLRIHDQV